MDKPNLQDQINYIKDLRESVNGGIEVNILALPQESMMLNGILEHLHEIGLMKIRADQMNDLLKSVELALGEREVKIKRLQNQLSELTQGCEQLINADHYDHFAVRLNNQEMKGLEMIKSFLEKMKEVPHES